MNAISRFSPAIFALFVAGCGAVELGRPSAPAIPEASQNELKASFRDAQAKMLAGEDDLLDAAEADTTKALRVALGKEPSLGGAAPSRSASTVLRALRAAKVPVKVGLRVAEDGKVDDEIVELKVGGRAAADPNALDLQQRIAELSFVTMSANLHVLVASLEAMVRVSNLVRTYERYGMQLDAEDLALVKRGLVQQRRIEAIAGSTMGLLASYEAIVNGDGDPKTLDVIAQRTLAAFPIHVDVSDDEAKAHVDSLAKNAAKLKPRYEAAIRKFQGDKKYEREWKARIDDVFARIGRGAEPERAHVAAKTAARSTPAATTALDVAAEALPDGAIATSLKGISALQRGDAKGALQAAVSLIPIPGLKDVFGVASKLLFRS